MQKSTIASILGICGLVFCVVGVLVIVYFQEVVDHIVNGRLVYRKGSESFQLWSKPPVKPYTRIYFFNYTNGNDVLRHGSKPEVQEVGPYVYEETMEKVNVTWNDTEESVCYLQRKKFLFIRELSSGPEEDVVISVHPPFLGALALAHKLGNPAFKNALNAMFSVLNVTMFSEHTVREWLWGFRDQLLDLGRQTEPDGYPYDQFGYFYGKNSTQKETLCMHTGARDIKKMAILETVNGSSRLGLWPDLRCDAVQGTDGSAFPPGITSRDVLHLFDPELCRTVPLTFLEDVSHEGIRALRFVVSPSAFDSPRTNPDNACFCAEEGGACEDLPDGLFNVSICKFRSPVLLSWPHFLHGDPSLLDAVGGLHPDLSSHQGYMDIQPVWFRLQVNFLFHREPEVEYLANVSMEQTVLPVVWFESGMDKLTPELYSLLRKATEDPKVAEAAMTYLFLVLGGAMVLFVALFFVYRRMREPSIKDKKGVQVPIELQQDAPFFKDSHVGNNQVVV